MREAYLATIPDRAVTRDERRFTNDGLLLSPPPPGEIVA